MILLRPCNSKNYSYFYKPLQSSLDPVIKNNVNQIFARTISTLKPVLEKECYQKDILAHGGFSRNISSGKLELPEMCIDKDFLLNVKNVEIIRENIKARLSTADIDVAHKLHNEGGREEYVLAELVKEPRVCLLKEFKYPEHKNQKL